MNKRDNVLSLLDGNAPSERIPAAFFIHFDPIYHVGRKAVEKHLEYFRHTGMDFVKIQYENRFPERPEIQEPADWAKMPRYGQDFYQNQLDIVTGLVDAAKDEALVIMTLYSPFMCAGSSVGSELLVEHIRADPTAVKQGMEAITDSLMIFVKECIRLGVDGFYASTQGGEKHRLGGSPLFEECVKPYDLALMEEMNRHCIFNILHVCDYHDGYSSLEPYLDYPGHVVNCSLEVGDGLTGKEVSEMFDRPFMGGLDRHGVIAQGDEKAIAAAANDILKDAPDAFILGADCTLPNDANWDYIRTAIDAAHSHRR